MVYRRTHQVVKRLAARRSAILAAARDAAAEGGMAAVQIAPVAVRANVAAGTVYRYFPSKAELISELIAEVSRDELAAIRRAADAAPGPSSALAGAVTTVAVHVLSQRKLAWGILAEPVDVDVSVSRLASRREISGEIAARIDAAVRAGHLPAQDTALAATALLGALHESLVGPLAPENLDDPAKLRDAVQTVTLLALRAVGVMDARARGLVVQAVLPAKALVGADTAARHAFVATICHAAAYRRFNRDQEHAMTTTSGSAKWQGGIKDGKGAISTKSGALNDYPYGFASRFEGKPGSNPEELIGAAHAACFTMALSLILGEAKLTAEHMETKADVTLEKQGDGFAITSVHLTLNAKIPGADKATFEELAGKAKAGCPVSKLLNTKITLDATLQ